MMDIAVERANQDASDHNPDETAAAELGAASPAIIDRRAAKRTK
jgi:hypothetical protein